MDERIRRVLSRGHLIDITTTGRRTGRSRRIEVVFHNIGGRVYVTGRPGRRDWYANLLADSRMTFHLKGSVKADLRARAVPVTDPDDRRAIFAEVAKVWRWVDTERMFAASPLVEVVFEDLAA